MGFDLVAYFDVDHEDVQNKISQFIQEQGIDKDDIADSRRVADHFYYFYSDHLSIDRDNHMTKYPIHYVWNEDSQKHEIFTMYGTNMIRDDDRFGLINMDPNWTVRTAADAKEVAEALRVLFADDRDHRNVNVMRFADWLDFTVRHGCLTYDLSY
jgi:hypothetical protein